MSPERLATYKSLVAFLGEVMGEQFEIVLHVIEEKNVWIETIVNGQLSGRTENSPLTKFALELIESKAYLEKDYVTSYKTVTNTGKILQGATFFIKTDNQLEGMVCINMDYSGQLELAESMIKMLHLPKKMTAKELLGHSTEKETDDFTEILSENVQDIIHEYIDPSLINDNVSLTQEARLEIIRTLERKGVFQLKGAVTQVAKILKVSEPTIYRYRKIIEHSDH